MGVQNMYFTPSQKFAKNSIYIIIVFYKQNEDDVRKLDINFYF